MRIALIGTGNVATVMGRWSIKKGHEVVHVVGRNPEHATALASEFNCSWSGFNEINAVSPDLFIVAISDSALYDCAATFHTNPVPVVHTAGSVSIDVLKNISSKFGVLYPLQSLRREMQQIPEIPLLVDGNSPDMIAFLKNFAGSLSSFVEHAGDEQRLRLHAAAVIVSNFTNHLYSLGEEFCIKEQVNFNLLKPLILETAHRIMNASPTQVQTGPAVRKDIQTLDKHLRLLNNHPKLRTTYMRLTDSIMNP